MKYLILAAVWLFIIIYLDPRTGGGFSADALIETIPCFVLFVFYLREEIPRTRDRIDRWNGK